MRYNIIEFRVIRKSSNPRTGFLIYPLPPLKIKERIENDESLKKLGMGLSFSQVGSEANLTIPETYGIQDSTPINERSYLILNFRQDVIPSALEGIKKYFE